jgi:hypothetical protein
MTVIGQVGLFIDAVQDTRARVIEVARLLSRGSPPPEIQHAAMLLHDMRAVLAFLEVAGEKLAAEFRAVRADGVKHGIRLGFDRGREQGKREGIEEGMRRAYAVLGVPAGPAAGSDRAQPAPFLRVVAGGRRLNPGYPAGASEGSRPRRRTASPCSAGSPARPSPAVPSRARRRPGAAA